MSQTTIARMRKPVPGGTPLPMVQCATCFMLQPNREQKMCLHGPHRFEKYNLPPLKGLKPPVMKQELPVRSVLVSRGANESLTYSQPTINMEDNAHAFFRRS